MKQLQTELLTFQQVANVCECQNCQKIILKGLNTCTRVIRPCKCLDAIQESCLVEIVKKRPKLISLSQIPPYYKYQCENCGCGLYFRENFIKEFEPWNQISWPHKVLIIATLIMILVLLGGTIAFLRIGIEQKGWKPYFLAATCVLFVWAYVLILWKAFRTIFKRFQKQQEMEVLNTIKEQQK